MNILQLGDNPGELPQSDNLTIDKAKHFSEINIDQKYDLIYVTSILQTLPREQVVDALSGLKAVLKPEGEIHVRVPSLEWAAKELLTRDEPGSIVYHWIYGSETKQNLSGFTLMWLRIAVMNAGFLVRHATQLLVEVNEKRALENYVMGVYSDGPGA